MNLKHKAITDIGNVRTANEDEFLVDQDLGLYLVTDGMGGQAAGDVASQLAVDEIVKFIRLTAEQSDITWPLAYRNELNYDHNRLDTAFILANKKIFNEAVKDRTKRGMGTTAIGALHCKGLLQIAHVGDSRAYLLRDEELSQLTRDHSWVGEQMENGIISKEQAQKHPYRHVITRALGASPSILVDHIDVQLKKDDVVLLCSDGLTGMVSDEEIKTILTNAGKRLTSGAKKLVEKAKSNGGLDNITLILLAYTD